MCLKPGRPNTFGHVYTNTFGVVFGNLVCDNCANLLFMLFEEITDQMSATPTVSQQKKLKEFASRRQNRGGGMIELPSSPKEMVNNLLRDIEKGE